MNKAELQSLTRRAYKDLRTAAPESHAVKKCLRKAEKAARAGFASVTVTLWFINEPQKDAVVAELRRRDIRVYSTANWLLELGWDE